MNSGATLTVLRLRRRLAQSALPLSSRGCTFSLLGSLLAYEFVRTYKLNNNFALKPNRQLAEDLIARRVPFMDTAGNVYLDVPEATIMITGRHKPALKHSDTTSRSTTPKGLRVSFALDDLVARRLLVKKNGVRVIADRHKFVKDWVGQYPRGLRPKLGARRFASGMGIDWWKNTPLAPLNARLGGECAAEALTHENKPVSVTVYAHGGTAPALVKAGRLRPDPAGEVEILESFWPEHAEESWDAPLGVVHPLLVFADLLASGDSRNHAVADVLYERYLDH